MRHYPASNLTPGHPNSLQNVRPKGAADWTSIINDEIAYVRDGGVMRVYQFQAASTTAENIPEVVIPTGNATGTGRWHQIEFYTGLNGVNVQDEGGNVTNTPHTTLNFTGAGVDASDAGAGVTDITIPGGGGGSSLVDYVEEDTTGAGDLYTLRNFEDPLNIVEGTGSPGGSGVPGAPSWEGDVWKDQFVDTPFAYFGTLLYLGSSGWDRTRADASNGLVNGKLGISINPHATTPTGGQSILVKGSMAHLFLGSLPGGAIGDPIYVAQASWGGIEIGVGYTEGFVRQIGYKMGSRKIWFEPSDTIIDLGGGGGE